MIQDSLYDTILRLCCQILDHVRTVWMGQLFCLLSAFTSLKIATVWFSSEQSIIPVN